MKTNLFRDRYEVLVYGDKKEEFISYLKNESLKSDESTRSSGGEKDS